VSLLAGLTACATDRTYPPAPVARHIEHAAPQAPAPRPSAAPATNAEGFHAQIGRVSDLKGWAAEDHLTAFLAFRAGCKVAKDEPLRSACKASERVRVIDDESAKFFFEQRFRVEFLPGEGVLTGYFAPVYPARAGRDAEYSAPVRPPPPANRLTGAPAQMAVMSATSPGPADRAPTLSQALQTVPSATTLLTTPDGRSSADVIGNLLDLSTPPTDSVPVMQPPEPTADRTPLRDADRALIEQATAEDAVAWMRPEDLFFMQIQGSGVLVFQDGRRKRAAYAGDNGKPFVGIARVMVRDGLLPANGASGDAIRHWLSTHAGAEAELVMRKNPRYVFFRIGDDTQDEPRGAAGVPLPPGRAIAMDSSHHAFGAPYWIDAEAPLLAGAAAQYHRLAVALDTGGAIRGPIRADLYFGTGDAAGREAGRVRHVLRLARLVPIESEPTETGDASTARSGRR
jgi:membrane-bound lytic murein transglycosylase A